MTVGELIEALKKQPPDIEVSVWLPGSEITLSAIFVHQGKLRIEGNVMPGSALDAWPEQQ